MFRQTVTFFVWHLPLLSLATPFAFWHERKMVGEVAVTLTLQLRKSEVGKRIRTEDEGSWELSSRSQGGQYTDQ